MGAAIAVKPLILPAAIPVGWWLWSRRRADHLAAAVGAAVALWLASALPWGLGHVWDQSVAYNSGAGPRYAKTRQLRKLFVDAHQPRPARGRRAGARARHGDRRRDPRAGRVRRRRAAIGASVRSRRRRGDRGLGDRDRARARARARALPQPPRRRSCRRSRCSPRSSCARRARSRSLLVVLLPFSVAHLHDILGPTGYRGASAELMQRAARAAAATRR